jgi:nitroimidazol reductase NimA-like FMN-containing flavoprotein (pyridoxamine 5'-phosphate oxidase superfamily)
MATTELEPTDRTRLRRYRDRGSYDVDIVHAILDEALIAHVSFVVDGQPWLIPMTYGRIDDCLYFHGASGNHALRALADGAPACVAVTLLDGIVVSRAAFHMSMNYRSVVLFGFGEAVEGDEKRTALEAVVDHVLPGSLGTIRPIDDGELRMASVVRFPIVEASAKIRTGPPIEEPDDYARSTWGGEIPLTLAVGEPVDDGRVADGVPIPAYATTYRRG